MQPAHRVGELPGHPFDPQRRAAQPLHCRPRWHGRAESQSHRAIRPKPETIVYTLNPRAVWSDGVPITAADFKYAWLEQRAVPSNAPDSVASVEGYRDIASVTGTNKGRTVTVKFRSAAIRETCRG